MSKTCNLIHQLAGDLKRHRFPYDGNEIPNNGIYLLFENGEAGHDADRIVRVGTHTGEDQLPSRLDQHFIMENKDRSIFRKNIGRSILMKNKDPFLNLWNLDLTSRVDYSHYSHLIDIDYKNKIEREVTGYIRGNFSFVVFAVEDKSTRLALEKMLIATIAQCDDCKPSPDWHGKFSPKIKIKQSGLWQEQHIANPPMKDKDIELLREFMI